MNTEVQANLSFSDLKRGDRIQVDINDPAVAALVAAKYLRIIWEAPDGVAVRSRRVADVSGDRVDSGDPGAKEEVTDGAGEDFSGA